MDTPQWARVKGDTNCRIRRGAWYQVLRLTPDAAILAVGQRSLSVPRELLQIEPFRPHVWSVVSRPYDAIDLPIAWGSRYGVCPRCQARMPLQREQRQLQCARCGNTQAIDWS
ncbi:MAG TPA: hypothetical protein VG454_10105 [Gemmatimonadales bacterium]|nr:hypothetical protein [Gemmatimonadales bacterium]